MMSEEKPKRYKITVEIPTVEDIIENLKRSFPVVKFEVEKEKKPGEEPTEP